MHLSVNSQSKTKAMRALLGLSVLLLAAGSLALWKPWQPLVELKVMSFNIRNGHGKDGDNRWDLRKDLVAEVIREASPDVIGLQEAYHFQLEYLLEKLPEYASVGCGRDGGESGEYCAILYRKQRFSVSESDTFWLSESIDVPSTSWGHHYKRICTWARLVDAQTQRAVFIYNTHMDHESALAREKGAELIMQTIAKRSPQNPFLLCGDFNADEVSTVIGYFKGTDDLEGANPIPLVDSWRVIHPDESACGTVSGFSGKMEPRKIDSIFTPPDTEVLAADILRGHREGRYPSDHYPVTARLRLQVGP